MLLSSARARRLPVDCCAGRAARHIGRMNWYNLHCVHRRAACVYRCTPRHAVCSCTLCSCTDIQM
eukprot:12952475-Alexandrium_andersonii.AAC.1